MTKLSSKCEKESIIEAFATQSVDVFCQIRDAIEDGFDRESLMTSNLFVNSFQWISLQRSLTSLSFNVSAEGAKFFFLNSR